MTNAGESRTLPSGRQHELAYRDQHAVVVEVGGGLRTYRVGDWDVLDGYGPDEMCTAGRGQVLAPWPNRLRDGRYRFDRAEHQVPLTEPERGNAIHGLVQWSSWLPAGGDRASVSLRHMLHPQPGYPFTIELTVGYRLDDDGLTVRADALNAGDRPCPFGMGAHPYLRLGAGVVDPLVLHAPAQRWMPTDERQIPTGSASVAGTPYDFRTPRPIGDMRLDTPFAELDRDERGRARVELRADSGRAVTLWCEERYRYLMLFSGDTVPEVDRRRRSLAVEPMTCPPNAFQSGEDLAVLQPGERLTAAWGITARR